MIELTPSDFNGKTLKKYKDKIVLILFYTEWCGYCKRVKPVYNELAQVYKNDSKKIIAKFDCEKYGDFIQNEYNTFAKGVKIEGYPTILLYKDGAYLTKYSGERTTEQFVDFLNRY